MGEWSRRRYRHMARGGGLSDDDVLMMCAAVPRKAAITTCDRHCYHDCPDRSPAAKAAVAVVARMVTKQAPRFHRAHVASSNHQERAAQQVGLQASASGLQRCCRPPARPVHTADTEATRPLLRCHGPAQRRTSFHHQAREAHSSPVGRCTLGVPRRWRPLGAAPCRVARCPARRWPLRSICRSRRRRWAALALALALAARSARCPGHHQALPAQRWCNRGRHGGKRASVSRRRPQQAWRAAGHTLVQRTGPRTLQGAVAVRIPRRATKAFALQRPRETMAVAIQVGATASLAAMRAPAEEGVWARRSTA